MKCSIMLHFIRVFTVFKGKKYRQAKECDIFENYYLTPLYTNVCTTDCPKFNVSNQKEKSISIQRVKKVNLENHIWSKKHACLCERTLSALWAVYVYTIGTKGAQWLSGRVLDLRLMDRGFEPHQRHCLVFLSKTH